MIRTVLGEVDAESVGPTMMHEHVFIDLRRWYEPGDQGSNSRFEPVRKERATEVNSAPLAFEDNLWLTDLETARAELNDYRSAGGSCLVDMTCEGLGGRPESLKAVSHATQVHIVLGCGFFVHEFHPNWVLPGVIGEIGMSHPPTLCELRVLRAAARAGVSSGASLHIHVDPHGKDAGRFVSICMDEGLPPSRVVCGHMDVRIDLAYHRDVLSLGANIGLDTFGTDVYFSGLLVRPDDPRRMDLIAALVEAGFEDQVVLAQDVAFKCHLRTYGGNGYDHLLTRVIPVMLHSLHIPKEVVDKFLVHNPRRILSLAA